MKKTEITFGIIKKLEKAEKKALRLEISKYKSCASYILIYNYFDKRKEFNERYFKEFCKKNELKNVLILVNQLLDKMLEVLIRYRNTINIKTIEFEIRKHHNEANIYRELGFLKESAKKYKKALQLATKHKKYLLMPELIWEVGQSALVIKDTSILKNINPEDNNISLLDQMKLTAKRIEDSWLDSIVFMELLILNLVELPLKEQNDKLKALLEYKPKKYDSDNFDDVSNYFNIKISQAYAANNTKKYIKLIKELLAQFPVFFKSGTKDSLLNFSARLFGLYQKQFFVEKKHFKHQFMNFNKHILSLAKQYQLNYSRQLKKINEVRQSDLLQMGLFFENNLTTSLIKKSLPPDEKIDFLIGQNTYQKMLAIASLQFLIIKDYKNSDICYLRLQSMKGNTRFDKILYDYIEIVELIKAYEQNDSKYLALLIKKNKSALIKNYGLSPVNEILLTLIINLNKAATSQYKKLLQETLKTVKQFEKTQLRCILPYSYWLKHRIKEATV